jgi:SAM-dependent methyltransferase
MVPNELERLRLLGWLPEEHAALRSGVWEVGIDARVNYPDGWFPEAEPGSGGTYWYDHRAEQVAAVLARFSVDRLWEVGAGSGAMGLRLHRAGVEVVSVEPLVDGARIIAAATPDPVFCGLFHDMALPDDCIPAVGAFDVVEHLDRPDELLAEIRRVLAPGGLIVVTVPALQWLWSDSDDVAGHQVRYTRRTLREQMSSCGLAEVHAEYLYASLVGPGAVMRALPYRLGRRRNASAALESLDRQLDPSPRVDRAVRRVLALEARVAQDMRLPWGTSLLGVYRRAL